MRQRVYFDAFRGSQWPSPSQLQHYFLSPAGRRRAFDTSNDSWGLSVEGVDGTEHLPDEERIDIHLTILGNLDHGVLLHYRKWGGASKETYWSKADLGRLREWVETRHGDLMPVGLYIPFERAWAAVKEFMERDGALPKSIEWADDADVPEDAFPDPYLHRLAGR
jgi:Immunity protein Imm1